MRATRKRSLKSGRQGTRKHVRKSEMTEQFVNFLAKPDYDHWSEMARWEFDALAALSLDCDPQIVSLESVRSEQCPAEVRDKYLKRYEIIENHKQAGRFHSPPEPGEFLSWMISNGFECPPALKTAVERRGHLIGDWKSEIERLLVKMELLTANNRESEEKLDAQPVDQGTGRAQPGKNRQHERPLVPKEQRSLLALVLGMAMKHYKYNPSEGKTTAATSIKNDLIGLGIKIDDQTVLDWLRRAVDQVVYELP